MINNENVYLAIDLGSSRICACSCLIAASGEITIMGVGTSITKGATKNGITNSNTYAQCIAQAIERAKNESKLETNKVVVNFPFADISFQNNTGIYVSKNEEGQISFSDKAECIKRACQVPLKAGRSNLHSYPIEFKVDGHIVKNPVGVFGEVLEVSSYLISCDSKLIVELKQVLNSLGLTIYGLLYDGLSQGATVLSEEYQNRGTFLLDFGGKLTKFSLFKNQKMIKSYIIDIGSNILTSDLSTCLNVSMSEAERLKILHGNVYLKDIKSNESIEVNSKKEGVKEIKKILISQILEARVKEIFSFLKKEMATHQNCGYKVVCTGAGSLLKGFSELFYEECNLPCQLGISEEIAPASNSMGYTNAIGLIAFALKSNALDITDEKMKWYKNPLLWLKKHL